MLTKCRVDRNARFIIAIVTIPETIAYLIYTGKEEENAFWFSIGSVIWYIYFFMEWRYNGSEIMDHILEPGNYSIIIIMMQFLGSVGYLLSRAIFWIDTTFKNPIRNIQTMIIQTSDATKPVIKMILMLTMFLICTSIVSYSFFSIFKWVYYVVFIEKGHIDKTAINKTVIDKTPISKFCEFQIDIHKQYKEDVRKEYQEYLEYEKEHKERGKHKTLKTDKILKILEDDLEKFDEIIENLSTKGIDSARM